MDTSAVYYVAVYDFDAENEAELTLREGDVVQVLHCDGEWWEGELQDGRLGLFPANRVVEYTEDTATPVYGGEGEGAHSYEASHQQVQPQFENNNPLYQQQVQPSRQQPTQAAVPAKASGGGGGGGGGAAKKPAVGSLASTHKNTTYGPWASNMAILSGPIIAVLGFANIVWSVKDEETYGQTYIFSGLYAIVLGVGMFSYEKYWGGSRDGSKMPTRGIVYAALLIFLCFGVPTAFGASWVLCVAIANFVAARNGEKYEAPKKRKAKKQEKVQNSMAVGQLSLGAQLVRWVRLQKEQNSTGTLVFMFLYAAANVVIFVNALIVWVEKNNNFPENERLSQYAPLAKAFGNFLDFNCAIIVVPVLRTMIRWLYKASTANEGCFAKFLRGILFFVPLDKNLSFHKIIAKMVAFGAIGHTVFHLVNYIESPDNTLKKFGVWPWVSGGIVFICMLLMYGAVFKNVKGPHFEIFWYSHHCFIPFFFFLLLHGDGWFNPNFWKWFVGPGSLYIIERILRIYRAKQPVVLLSVTHMKPNVVSLEFDKQGVFADDYKEGMYIFLCCPTLSEIQWHPFTISSAPREKTVTVHIKTCGPGSWTQNLQNYLGKMGAVNRAYIELTRQTDRGLIPGKIIGPDGKQLLQIDGPHAAPTMHVPEYHTAMVIGSGIGVTPVAATLKSVVLHRWKFYIGHCFPDNAYFYWVCAHRDIDSFRWLIRAIKDCEDEIFDMRSKNQKDMAQKRFEIHIFVTSVPKGQQPIDVVVDDEIGFWGVPREEKNVEKVRAPFNELDLYKTMYCPPDYCTLGDVHIYSGRPQWDARFSAVAQAHPRQSIGIAFCGNAFIASDLEKYSRKYSSIADGRIFKLHSENF